MPNHAQQIKSMKLYTHIERVQTELNQLGKGAHEPLQAAELSAFDQLHYHGTVAVDHCIDQLGIHAGQSILEIGSGLGGPARHIAARTAARVTALELQPDQHRLAAELTRRCQLAEHVQHVSGDFLSHPWAAQKFDHIVSWLALFHIPERQKLLDIVYRLLQPGGVLFAEDMYSRKPMNSRDRAELASGMYASYLPDWQRYRQDFIDAGLVVRQADDMSADWCDFTTTRLQAYRQARERHIAVHGRPTYEAMEAFYALVNRHFRAGHLGGVRMVACRPE